MDVQRLDIVLDKKSNRKVVNQRFRLLQTIGQGQFGKVLLAEDLTQDHGLVAIKTINRVDRAKLITKTYLSHTTKICREIQIMKECDHPNVVKSYQVIDDLKFDKILLVLEYCNFGEIDWKKYNHFHEKYHKDGGKGITLNKIVRDVVNGLEYLHSYKQIIHRDLKPSNLLISSDRTIKISDFGVSLILENNTNDDKELGKTMGTPAFYAPELCQFVNNRLSMLNEADMARSKIDARIDVWSLGVVIYCLFFHQLPFEGHNEFSLFKTIVNGELKFPRTRESSHVRLEDLRELELLKELIKQILAKDPNSRPTLTEIKHHKFTTFELSKKETEKFYSFNKNIISQQDPLAAEAWEADNRMSHKIKRLFGAGKNEPSIPAPPMSRPISVEHPTKQIKGVDALDLENVDDLLDSYLDDSSSMGSLSEEEGASSVIDTTQILSSIKMDAEKLPHSTLKKSDSAQSRLSRSSVPPPLKLSSSSFSVHKGGSTSSFQPPASPFSSGQRTPSTATSNTVTIGEGSPSSIKSIFSPSRRFFAKIKPTINSLYSPTHGEGHTTSFSDLAPPPSFGRSDRRGSMSESISSAQSGFVPSGSGLGSRKNSISSTRSNGLSKMSSSSSSLNLHGYLTDESSTSFSGKWQKAVNREIDTDEEDDQHNSSDSEVGDQTLTYSPQTGTMDQYLDRLQS